MQPHSRLSQASTSHPHNLHMNIKSQHKPSKAHTHARSQAAAVETGQGYLRSRPPLSPPRTRDDDDESSASISTAQETTRPHTRCAGLALHRACMHVQVRTPICMYVSSHFRPMSTALPTSARLMYSVLYLYILYSLRLPARPAGEAWQS